MVFLFKLKKLTRNLCFLDGSYSTHGDVLFYPGEEMYKKGSWKRKKGRTSREKADTRDVTAHNYRLWPNAVLPYTIRYPNISKIFSFSFQNPGIFSNFLWVIWFFSKRFCWIFSKTRESFKKCLGKGFGESVLGRTNLVIMDKWVLSSENSLVCNFVF